MNPTPDDEYDERVTGAEPATGSQRSYVASLSQEANEPIDPALLTRAEAAQVIERLHEETGQTGNL